LGGESIRATSKNMQSQGKEKEEVDREGPPSEKRHNVKCRGKMTVLLQVTGGGNLAGKRGVQANRGVQMLRRMKKKGFLQETGTEERRLMTGKEKNCARKGTRKKVSRRFTDQLLKRVSRPAALSVDHGKRDQDY